MLRLHFQIYQKQSLGTCVQHVMNYVFVQFAQGRSVGTLVDVQDHLGLAPLCLFEGAHFVRLIKM